MSQRGQEGPWPPRGEARDARTVDRASAAAEASGGGVGACWIGVDPGLSGGIACLYSDGRAVARAAPTRVEPRSGRRELDRAAMAALLSDLYWGYSDALVAIERVDAAPMHGRRQGTTGMFRFGQGYGYWLGAMEALRVPFVEVPPRTWKKAILSGTARDKAAAIDYCRRLYPWVSLRATPRSRVDHDGMADALCLAVYARSVYRLREVSR